MSTTYQTKVTELLAQRKGLHEEMKALLDAADAEKRAITAEETAKFDALDTQITELDQQRKRYEDMDKREADLLEAQERNKIDLLDKDQRKGEPDKFETELRAFLKGERRSLTIAPDEPIRNYQHARSIATQQRDLTKGTATAGGHTVGTAFYSQLVDHMIEVSGILQAGPTVLVTERGENLPIPRTTAHSSATSEIAEAAAITESDPAFNQLVLSSYKYGNLIQASYELMEDTYVDLLGYIAMQAGRAVGNAFGTRLVTGTGSSQPQGAATAATTGVTGGAGVAGAFTADNLIDLFFSVIAPYRMSPSCGWLMRDATLAAVRKLKDSQNQYLWQPSLQVGAPDTLLGKPVHTDPNVAAVALSARSVLFGDFSRYFVRQVRDIRFERSDDYAFNQDVTTFRCLLRGDGGLADTSGALKAFVGTAA
ncbi:MAG: phage major capsid protein [Acidimicrobiales bacterium]